MIAAAAAVAALWTGAKKYSGPVARGYRWLGGAALFWLVGEVIGTTLSGPQSTTLSLADYPPLLALAALAIGIMVIGSSAPRPGKLSGLADGYVMAVSLLVICWVGAFGSEFHSSGERPWAFLLTLIHPLTDLAVLGALLPVLTVAWRHVLPPYLALVVLVVADTVGVGARLAGGYPGVIEQLGMVLAACLLGIGPWLDTIVTRLAPPIPGLREGGRSAGSSRVQAALSAERIKPALRSARLTAISPAGRAVAHAGAAPVIAAVTVVAAAFAVLIHGLVTGPATGMALIIGGGAAVLVFAVRVVMLVREGGVATRMWRESGHTLLDLAGRTSDMVLLCDLRGTIRHASPAPSGFSYPDSELVGKNLADYVHPEDLAAGQAVVRHAIDTAVRTGRPGPDAEETLETEKAGETGEAAEPETAEEPGGRFDCRVRTEDGTWRPIQCAVLVYQMPGEPAQLLLTVRDLSDQVALRQRVNHLTFHDGLTGLPNRTYVEERTRDALRAADSDGEAGTRQAAVIFLDLDGFTAVNDLVGHGAGDLVLAQAARRLRAVVASRDTVARWGGDEFAVLVENAPGAQEVGELAERMAGIVSGEPFRAADREIRLTASVGVALADGEAPDVLLRNADVAMSRAKEGGGDRVEVYAAQMHADVVRRLDLAAALQRALDDDELTLMYQPVVDLATSRVTGAEALVRWRNEDEQVPPAEFLAVAEETGMITRLGDWVLDQACRQGAAWREAAWGVGVSVNLSLRQLSAARCVDRISAALASSGLPAEALTVEVGERTLVTDPGLVGRRLAELRELGVRVAIDDFGTGYAALAHLREIPVDVVKIDPSFTAGLGTDQVLTMLTKTIVSVGRDLGVDIVAEGIETSRQLTELREMGCGYGQGFGLARPMAVAGVEAMFRACPKPGIPAA